MWNEIVFLLNGTHKDFDLIEKNDSGIPSQLRTGDLLLRKIYDRGPYHVGIYCGKYVLEFTGNHFTLLTLKYDFTYLS